jgi:hypothetical protein
VTEGEITVYLSTHVEADIGRYIVLDPSPLIHVPFPLLPFLPLSAALCIALCISLAAAKLTSILHRSAGPQPRHGIRKENTSIFVILPLG